MPIFEIQAPDGKVYELDAPSQDAAVAAYHQFTQPAPEQPTAAAASPRFPGIPAEKANWWEAAPLAGEAPNGGPVSQGQGQAAGGTWLSNGSGFLDGCRARPKARQTCSLSALTTRSRPVSARSAGCCPAGTARAIRSSRPRSTPTTRRCLTSIPTCTSAGNSVARWRCRRPGLRRCSVRRCKAPRRAAFMALAAAKVGSSIVPRAPCMGGLTGGAAGALVGKVAGLFGNKAAQAAIPTAAELKAGANAAYKTAEDAGVIVAPEGIGRLARQVKDGLADFGYHPTLQPRVGVVLNELDRLSQQPSTLKGVDVMRRIAKNAAASIDPAERAIGNQIVKQIDDFVENLSGADVIGGGVDEAAAAIRQGRELWGRMRKSEEIQKAVTKAEHRAGSTGTGGNVDNAIRQNIRGILDNEKKVRGFTQAEKDAMERVVMGTPAQNTMRLVGRLSPRGNGLMAALGGGATMANPAIAIPAMVLTDMAKRVDDRATPKNVAMLDALVRSGGKSTPEMIAAARAGTGPQKLIDALGGIDKVEGAAKLKMSAIAAALQEKARP